ncbi:hypothetical protein HY484_03440 [Candidatus Woesearchaeota archaeon]|nr:hypothetical protein [Candidatus Woesearchaeota archaeon]
MEGKAPAFVRVDNYKNVMNTLGVAKEKIAQAKALLAKIAEVKSEEDAIVANWNAALDAVEERVAECDSALLEPEK